MNPTALTSGESMIASEASRSPCTRFMTPGGRSISSISSKSLVTLTGVCSDCLTMKVLPAAMA